MDVTSFLREGENVLAVHTYYQGLINRVWVSGDDRHGLLLDLEVNGETIVQSDTSFLCYEHTGFIAMGKVGYDTQFMELYNSAAAEVGFEAPDFDDRSWTPAVYRENLDYQLFPQPSKQLVFEKIAPVSLRKTERGYIADFGSVYVGYMLLSARGKPGGRITLLYGQELNADGSVRFELRANCRYEEAWILSGKTDSLNQFDYKSFRYVEVRVPPDGCGIDESSLFLLARHYPFELKAEYALSDAKLRAVWNLCTHSLKYGVQEVIQDCMEREKGQYLGDGCYSSIAHGIATGDFAIFEKLIREALYSSFVNKGFMTCAPGSMMQEIADYPLLAPMSCMMYYQLTENKAFLREIFPGLRDMLWFYRDSYGQSNGLLNNLDKWCIVEWPASSRDGYDVDISQNKVCTTMHVAINALYIGAGKFLNKMAALLDEGAVVETAPLVKAFHEAFYDAGAGLFKDSVSSSHISLPGNAYPLLFNLCPNKECEDKIVAMIRRKRLTSVMFFISYPVLAGLVRTGKMDLARELIADDGAWLRMISEGATTTFEGWGKDTKWNTSLFHLCFTYPVQFLTNWGMEKVFEDI
jgi:hypothetical protein